MSKEKKNMATKSPDSSGRAQVHSARAPGVVIEVTQEFIDESVRRDSAHCMIAEALKKAVPGARYVSVDIQTIRFSDPDQGKRPYRYTYLTPRSGQLALIQFDAGVVPEPFRIRLRGGAVSAAGKYQKRNPLVKQRLIQRSKSKTTTSPIPEIVGGKTPPRAALSSNIVKGRRREFGLRAFIK